MKSKTLLSAIFFLAIATSFAQFQNKRNLPFTWKTDTINASVPLSEIQIVLPKGSFPTLDAPKFVNKDEGLTMFFKNEPVIALEINGNAKAYSLNVLTMHEIANDQLGGESILVTYCPLCNSGIVYNRNVTINGENELLEFEASGMLRNSDMVMLDRKTETLWQQLIGTAIVGTYNETQLETIPSIIISVEEFFMRYPFGEIMSKDTGFNSAKYYGTNPYKGYDTRENPRAQFFNSDKVDKRLPAMERVVDIEDDGDYKIYTFTTAQEKGVINDAFKNKSVVLFYKEGAVSILDEGDISTSRNVGSVTVFNAELDGRKLSFSKINNEFIDNETKSTWDITGYCTSGKLKGKQLQIRQHSNHFAFAWLAFYPESEIYNE
ncbi:MAG: DUF3179 domain-containing protein [Flavobacteriaceae bacterium]